MPKINFRNLTTNELSEGFFKEVVEKVFVEEKIKDAQLDIAIVGPARIRALNKKFKRKNKVTDVLSFPVGFKPRPSFYLGEVVVCYQVVKKQAHRAQVPEKKHLSRILIHGILHLLGYDHEKSKEDEILMFSKEDKILNLLWQEKI